MYHLVRLRLFTLLLLFLFSPFAVSASGSSGNDLKSNSGKIIIAAAAQLKFAMDALVADFKATHPTIDISVVYGSSGKLFAQIQQGAPYDLYFSADMVFPQQLVDQGLTSSGVHQYATGRLVLWSNSRDASQMTLSSLRDATITRVAIANPQHAPYGMRAEEALHAANLWTIVQPKLVFGESIAQATQFVQSGNAQLGIIALALALEPQLASQGSYWLIPDNLHQPLTQGFVLMHRAENNPVAQLFRDTVFSVPGQTILQRYGYSLPKIVNH